MRTTLTLDVDVATRVKRDAARKELPIKTLVNEALRLGLDALERRSHTAKPYKTRAVAMGMRPGLNHDNIGELLARAEGEDYA